MRVITAVNDGFLSQSDSNVERVFKWWRHHGILPLIYHDLIMTLDGEIYIYFVGFFTHTALVDLMYM